MRTDCLLTPFLVLTSSLACGDGMVRDLPPAGQWSKYRMSEKWSDGTRHESMITIKRLPVTSEIVSGLTWLEVVFETPDDKTRSAFRFLTPEKSLASGDPLAEAVDVWARRGDGASTRLSVRDWANILPRLSLICTPKLANDAGKVEFDEIEVRGEKFMCSQVRGAYSKTFRAETVSSDCVLSASTGVPFGVAHAAYRVRLIGGCDPDPTAACNLTTGDVEFTAIDFGDDAAAVVDVTLDDSK